MKGVTFPGDRTVEFVDFPDPTPGMGEVVVEIKASGMCGSDLKSYRRAKGTAIFASAGNEHVRVNRVNMTVGGRALVGAKTGRAGIECAVWIYGSL